MELPSITVNIAVYNEEHRISRCLESIFSQNYPKDKLEVLIVDGLSTDRTVEIASRYPTRILINRARDPASGRSLGLLNATGDLHIYLDADMELVSKEWFRKMSKPLIEDQEIVGSFTRFVPDRRDPPLNRVLSYNPFQLDPMLEFLSPNIDSCVVAQKNGYDICLFRPKKVPLVGVILFRTRVLKELYQSMKSIWPTWMWSDLDFPIAAAVRGYCKFAYVRDAGIYHRSYINLSTLFKKKRRDIQWSFLTTYGQRYATYVDFGSLRDKLKLIAWVLYSNSLVLPLVNSILKAIRYNDSWCLVYMPLLTCGVTDYLIVLMLVDRRGRKLLRSFFGKDGRDVVRNI